MGLLRFLLAISVVIAHSSSVLGVSLVGGLNAVQSFYIISGFYMTLILKEKYTGVNDSFKLFITNRLLRLYPIYWAVALLTILISVIDILYIDESNNSKLLIYQQYLGSMDIKTLLFLVFTNIFMLFQDVVMFMGFDISEGAMFFTTNFRTTELSLHKFLLVPPAWTIGVEIMFYIIVPFLVRRKLWVIGLLLVLSVLLRVVLYKNGLSYDPWNYRFFPTELAFFLMGIFAYYIYKRLRKYHINKYLLLSLFSAILLSTILYNFIPIPGKRYLYLLSIFFSIPFIFSISKNWKIDRLIGELSYPIYISHVFIISLTSILHLPVIESEQGLSIILYTIFVSIILNQLIAKKVEKIRQRRVI